MPSGAVRRRLPLRLLREEGVRRLKCSHCNGKGGWVVKRLLIDYFQPCPQCLGKGKWWPNNKPKRKNSK